MSRRWIGILNSVLLPLLAVMALSGCQGGLRPIDQEDAKNPSRTGKRTLEGIPYTSTHPQISRSKKQMVADPANPTPEEERNLELANSIEGVKFYTYSEQNQPTREVPAKYRAEIQVMLNGTLATLVFQGELEQVGRSVFIRQKTELRFSQFSLEGVCADKDCQKDITLTLFRMKQTESGWQKDGFVNIHSRSYWAQVDWKNKDLPSDEETLKKDPALARMAKINEANFAWVTNWETSFGSSFHQVELYKGKTKSVEPTTAASEAATRVQERHSRIPDPRELEHLFTLHSPSVETSNHDVRVEINGDSKVVPDAVEMVGDGVQHDLRFYRVVVNRPPPAPPQELAPSVGGEIPLQADELQPNAEGTTTAQETEIEAMLEIIGLEPLAPPTSKHSGKQMHSITAMSYFKTEYGNPQKPNTQRMIDDFDSNWWLKKVQDAIQVRLTRPEDRKQLETFFRNVHPFKPYIETIFNYYDVPPALVFNTVLESRFFTDEAGSYPIEKGPGSSAVGPAQFIIKTAQSNGLVVNSKLDERKYAIPTTCGMANYWRKLARYVGQGDSTIVVLAWLIGEGGAGGIVTCVKKYDGLNQQKQCVNDIITQVKRGRKKTGPNQKFMEKIGDAMVQSLAKYEFTLEEVLANNLVPSQYADYVYKFLALYFIGSDPDNVEFQMPELPLKPGKLPDKVSIPSTGISSKECRDAVNGQDV